MLRSSSWKSVSGTVPNLFIIECKLLFNIFTDDCIVLRTPQSVYTLMPNKKMTITVYFSRQLSNPVLARRLIHYLPDQVSRWGKIRIIGESECMQSVYAQKSVGEKCRDTSFARVSLI